MRSETMAAIQIQVQISSQELLQGVAQLSPDEIVF